MAYQNRMRVQDLSVETDVNEFNMFQSKLKAKINIKGELKYSGNGYEMYIKNVHVSERIENENGNGLHI